MWQGHVRDSALGLTAGRWILMCACPLSSPTSIALPPVKAYGRLLE